MALLAGCTATAQTFAANPTVHQGVIAAGSPAIAQVAAFIGEINPLDGQQTNGQVAQSLLIYRKNDGSGTFGFTIQYQ
jgi:hypothetical protein